MKKKWLFLGIALVIVILVAAIFLDPTYTLWGYLRGEQFYRGRSASYWQKAVTNADPVVQSGARQVLKEGGRDAVPVLIAMLGTKDRSDCSGTANRPAASSITWPARTCAGLRPIFWATSDQRRPRPFPP